jgi:hypothetical protein
VPAAQQVLGRVGQDVRERDERGDELERRDEQQRDEDELRRRGVAGPGLELHAPRGGEREHEPGDHDPRRIARDVDNQRGDDARRGERHSEPELDRDLAPAQPGIQAGLVVLQKPVELGVDGRRGGGVGHESTNRIRASR